MNTAMVRKIDDLGRVVIPAETRRLLNIHEGDELSIDVDGDRIVLRKREVTVAVGEYSFEMDRTAMADWERRVGAEIGSREPGRIAEEIKRRLGL